MKSGESISKRFAKNRGLLPLQKTRQFSSNLFPYLPLRLPRYLAATLSLQGCHLPTTLANQMQQFNVLCLGVKMVMS